MKLHEPVGLILRRKGSEVYSVSPDATVYEALQKLAERDIGAVLVLDGARMLGIFSERDYARQGVLKGRVSRETRVQEVMSSPVVTVRPETTIDECMQVMTRERCRHLPVVDGDRVVGMVSIGDLVNWIIATQDLTIHQLEDYISGKYPA